MKLKSIFGIIISILGVTLTIANWLSFTLQIPGIGGLFNSQCYECTYNIKGYELEHHEHSITLMILISVCFLFFLVISIANLSNSKKN